MTATAPTRVAACSIVVSAHMLIATTINRFQ